MSQEPVDKGRKYPIRIGNWLPDDQQSIKKWLDDLIKEVEEKYSAEKGCSVKLDGKFMVPRDWLDPLVQEFKDFVDNDATIRMPYTKMFTEVTEKETPIGTPQVQSYHVMFLLVSFIINNWAPRYTLFLLPINAILNWSIGTADGYLAFLNKSANEYWMKVLNKWGVFLKSPLSCYVLNDEPGGWFSESAMASMPDFEKEFICDPTAPHYGFTSWDDFFTRKFRDGVRPVASPDDKNVITNACESGALFLQYEVQITDDFWVKDQWYSLRDMLNDDPYTSQFVGGIVYQASLYLQNYHRWHSPVDGKVVKAYNIPGTYYSASLNDGKDPSAPDYSLGYLCNVATRAAIFIEADNPAIGLMCLLAVGIVEVSTCEINPNLVLKDGPKTVKKGDEIGSFHFGGSAYCLIFRPGVNLQFEQTVLDSIGHLYAKSMKLNSKLATVIN